MSLSAFFSIGWVGGDRSDLRYSLVEKHLIEFSTVAMQRPDFKKTDDMFNRVLGKDHIAVVCLLENKETGTRLIVANTHLHWDPAFSDVKLVQTALLIEEVEKIAQNFARYPPRLPPTPSSATSSATNPSIGETNGSARPPPVYTDAYKIPIVVCGDLNSNPTSGVYEFLSTGSLPPDHEDFLSHTYGKYTTEGLRHRLGLKSAYAGIGELSMTNYTPTFKGTLDYIWYTTANLAVNSVLGEVDQGYLDKVVGFPNAHFPSEYVVLYGHLVVYVSLMMCCVVVSIVTCVSSPSSASVRLGKLSLLAHRPSSQSRPRARTIEVYWCLPRTPSPVLCGPSLLSPLSLPPLSFLCKPLSCRYFNPGSCSLGTSSRATAQGPSFRL